MAIGIFISANHPLKVVRKGAVDFSRSVAVGFVWISVTKWAVKFSPYFAKIEAVI